MLITKRLDDVKSETYYKMLLLGDSKTGKTNAFRTFPTPSLAIGLTPRTRAALAGAKDIELVEHFEQKPTVKKKAGNIEYRLSPKAWDDLWHTIVDLWEFAHGEDSFPYRSVMLDDLSTANLISMNHVLGLKKKNGEEVPTGLAGAPAQQHYMPQMALMERLINSLFLTLPCHILVCGHMTFKENVDTGISAYYPAVFGNLRERIPSWFDEVYETAIVRKDQRTKYVWKTKGYGQKQFLGSTINKGLWKGDFEVDLTESCCGFRKMLEMKGGDTA